MKYFIAIIASTVLLIGCTPKSMKDNTHSVTPVYEETSNAEKLELKSLQEAEALFYKLYEGRDSEDPYTIITSLELMEKYLLNLENFKNPDIYSKGVLAPPFRKLIDLFSYQMVQGIKIKINDPRFEKVLTNYRATVFNACHIGNDDCQTVNPFKGPYGVTILTHILTKDVVRLEKETDKVPEQEIKNIVFSLDVLRSFRESETNLSGNLYIRFAATFFKNVDYNRTKDPFYHDYLQVLLNQMVNQSKAEANPVSCQIFQSIDPLQLQQIGTTLEPGLLTQLTRHYYKCKSPEEISAKLIEIEKNRKSEAIKEVDETSPWSRVYNDFYSRSHSLRKYSRKTLSTFGIQNELPLEIVYFLDRVYYSKINDAERRLVLSKMSQTELIELVGQLEQFAQENYIYAMLFTFATFNNSLEEGYNKFGSINTDFVQNVYDNLWNNMGDTWPDLKEHFAQLRLLLDLIESNLSRENVVSLKEKIDLLRNYRLEKKSIGDLINLTVTFPIVFATNYFAGTNGGGTMKLRFTYVDWMDNNIEIPTTKTLKDFFVGDGRTSLQLLDFGFRNYIPTEYERSVGLSAAIKNGFFDIVNFDIGKENKGTVANLKLLYSRYVEDNNGKYIDSRNALATYETEKDKYWDELVNFCASPISNPRKIEMSSFDRLFILNSKNISDTGGDPMLKHRQYIDSVYKNIDTLYANIEQTKRTYQIIETTLRESGYGVDEFKASALISLKPRFELLSSFIKHRSDYIKAMGTSSNNCLDRITAFQNYQQNLLQLKTAKYLLEVHAGITLLRKLELSNENASEMKSLITSSDLSIAETNAGKESLIEQLTNTNVLEVVETQLGLNGKNLLQEAINLLLIPHNLPNNFGYKITGLSEANNLNDKNGFLARLGGVNSSYFEISKQDQLFRVREEFRELSVSVGEFRQYFGKLGIEFAEVPQSLSNDEMIPLNPAIEFEVENIEFYQHNKTDKKKDTLKAFYREKPSDFLLGALEKFYGTNHSDRVFMYHSVGYQLADDFRSFWVSEKNQYLLGPLFSPTSIDVSNPESFCYLDAPFDRLTPLKGCEDIQPSAHFIVDLYNEATEQLYLDKDELSPLSNIGGELGDILDASYFSSRYIVQYDKDQILKDLKYAKFAEQPEKWTRFDQLLANYFTADTKRTSNGQSITVGEIQHTYQYEQFYENFIRLKFDKKLLDIPSSAEKIFRSQLRGKIFSSVNSTEEIIDAILFREHTTSPEDYPEISLLKKDLQLPNQDDLWAWHSFTVDQKRSDGSLILVNREEFEIDKFANLQNITFKEYKCSLLPTESDSDYSPQMEQYIQSSASFCTSKVHKWLDYRSCQRSKKLKMALEKMKKENPEAQIIDRSVDCPSDL